MRYPLLDGDVQVPSESERAGKRVLLLSHDLSPNTRVDLTNGVVVNYIDGLTRKPSGLHIQNPNCFVEQEARNAAWRNEVDDDERELGGLGSAWLEMDAYERAAFEDHEEDFKPWKLDREDMTLIEKEIE